MKKFAALDIDGTLVRWQLYHAVVDKLSKNGAIHEDRFSLLQEARMKWKQRKSTNEFKNYEKLLIKTFEDSLQEVSTSKFDKAIDEVFDQYSDQVYTYTRNLINDLKFDKYFLIAISGSHQELIDKIADKFGFDSYVGTQYHRQNGKFTGNKTLGSRDKKAKLQAIVKENDLMYDDSFAVGDSLSDSGMLEIVENPIAFNPDKELYEKAVANSWKIVIERKNVIYQLTDNGDGYVLA
ncbi:MAG: HAD-IB family hydrolase [Candidatus Saccharimonadales bacterium]